MTPLSITSEADASAHDPDRVRAGLRAYNEAVAGAAEFRLVNLFLRDSDGAARGGLLGKEL